MADDRIILVSEVRTEASRIEEDCMLSSQSHFAAAKLWKIVDDWLNLPAALLSAFAAFFAFTAHSIIAGVLSVVVLLLMTAGLFLAPGQRSLRHKNSAEKYAALRHRLRIFANLEAAHTLHSNQELVQALAALSEKKSEINIDSPQVPNWAYRKAKQQIVDGEATYLIDERATN